MTPENMKSTLLDDTKMSARYESHQSLDSRDVNEFNSGEFSSMLHHAVLINIIASF